IADARPRGGCGGPGADPAGPATPRWLAGTAGRGHGRTRLGPRSPGAGRGTFADARSPLLPAAALRGRASASSTPVPGAAGRPRNRCRGIIPRYFARGTKPDDLVQSARPAHFPRLRPGRASAPGGWPELPDHADRADRGDVLPDDPAADEARQGPPRHA